MKNNLLCIYLFLFFVSCDKKSNIAIIETNNIINFGNVKIGDTIYGNYKIKNKSENILKIKNVKSSCGCTIAKLKDTVVNPKSETQIKIRFIAKEENIGKISNSVVIEANTNPIFNVLYLNGTVSE
jgi:hypothetical protein